MTPDILTQLGIGGIFAILVIRYVLEFLKSRNENGNPVTKINSLEIKNLIVACKDSLQRIEDQIGKRELDKNLSNILSNQRVLLERSSNKKGD